MKKILSFDWLSPVPSRNHLFLRALSGVGIRAPRPRPRDTGVGAPLPDRAWLTDRQARCLGTGRPLAVVLLEIPNLTLLLTSFGRARRDGLLRKAAGQLRQAVGEDLELARVDDRGLALLARSDDPEALAALARRCVAALSRRFAIDGAEARLHCRAGIAVYPEDGADPGALLNNALMALAFSAPEPGSTSFFRPAYRRLSLPHGPG